MLTRFWERVGDGRDTNDPSLFKTGEEVLPKGPPRVSHWLAVLTTFSHAFQQGKPKARKRQRRKMRRVQRLRRLLASLRQLMKQTRRRRSPGSEDALLKKMYL
jgi:hypothetical protein